MQSAISYSIVLLNDCSYIAYNCCVGRLCPVCYIAKSLSYAYGIIFRTICICADGTNHMCMVCTAYTYGTVLYYLWLLWGPYTIDFYVRDFESWLDL